MTASRWVRTARRISPSRSRVVSMPYSALFDAQPQSCRAAVLPPPIRSRVSIEAAAPFGWERYVGPEGAFIGVNGSVRREHRDPS
jgi:transketolase